MRQTSDQKILVDTDFLILVFRYTLKFSSTWKAARHILAITLLAPVIYAGIRTHIAFLFLVNLIYFGSLTCFIRHLEKVEIFSMQCYLRNLDGVFITAQVCNFLTMKGFFSDENRSSAQIIEECKRGLKWKKVLYSVVYPLEHAFISRRKTLLML